VTTDDLSILKVVQVLPSERVLDAVLTSPRSGKSASFGSAAKPCHGKQQDSDSYQVFGVH